jgi:hypothetical protein
MGVRVAEVEYLLLFQVLAHVAVVEVEDGLFGEFATRYGTLFCGRVV